MQKNSQLIQTLASKSDLDIKEEEEDLDDEMEEPELNGKNGESNGSHQVVDHVFSQSSLFEDESDTEDQDDKGEIRTCSDCQAMFTAKKDLRYHMRSRHVRSCFWTCSNCGAVFKDVELFKIHLVKVHKLNKEIFTLDSPESNPLLKPRLTIPDDVINCPECDVQYANITSLNLHRLRRHISKRLTKNVPCPVCNEEAEDLTHHVRTAHDIDGVVCPHCAKILSKTCTLNRHIEQVHLNLQIHKPATCNECGKVFSKKGHLDRHVRTIHLGLKESSEPCPHCGKVFSTKSSLEPHIAMVHNGVRKACPECGKVLSDLWKHMRTVHGQYRRKAKIPKEALDLDSDVLKTNRSEASKEDSDTVVSTTPKKIKKQAKTNSK